MSYDKNDSTSPQKESEKILGESINQVLEESKNFSNKEYLNNNKIKEKLHLNSIITKNISLFTANPNYKMLAWLIAQLIIFSLFVFAINIFKNNFIPYFNS